MTPPLSGGSAPATPEADGVVAVTQADRGQAARLLVEQWTKKHGGIHSWMTASVAPVLLGHEDNSAEVQAFARHRIASTEGLVEALRNLTDRHFLDGGSLTEPAYLAARAALAKAAGK